MKLTKLFFLFFSLFIATSWSQSLTLPVSHPVYNLLDDLNAKGAFNIDLSTLPLPISVIIPALQSAQVHTLCTAVDREGIERYLSEFLIHTEKSDVNPSRHFFLHDSVNNNYRPFGYRDSLFSVTADIVLGLSYTSRNYTSYKQTSGIDIQGVLGTGISYSFRYRDYQEHGEGIDTLRQFTPETGYGFLRVKNNLFDYNEVFGSLGYSWTWGNVYLAKEHLKWGYGYNSSIIFSSKAPSFPHIRFSVTPASWIRFDYMHGVLNSQVIDSSETRSNINPERLANSLVDKYIVAHKLSLYPTSNLKFSLGESVVYSDKFEPIYLIPVLFFRLADHYAMGAFDEAGGNAQLFADVEYKMPAYQTQLYGTVLIDEFSISSIFSSDVKPSATAFTLGIKKTNAILENASLTLEYTRLNPFVYYHSDDADMFTNYRYQLGDWIGSNADRVLIAAKYNFPYFITFEARLEHIRRGEKEDPIQPRYQPNQTFLFGDRETTTFIHLTAEWSPVQSVRTVLSFNYSNLQGTRRAETPVWLAGVNNGLTFEIALGL